MKVLQILNNIDRRIIYLLLSVVVMVPLILKSKIDIVADPYSETAFNEIESEFAGELNKKMLISFDYGPSTSTEVNPMAIAIMKHVLITGNEVHTMALFDTGLAVSEQVVEKVLKDPQIQELSFEVEENIKQLGYVAGGEAAIKNMLKNIESVFPSAPSDIKSLCDYDFIVTLSSGTPGTMEWVSYAGDPSEKQCKDRGAIKLTTGVTAVQAPESIPFVGTGQLKGMLAGLSGASGYEALMEYADRGLASEKMPAQSWAHLLIIFLIVIGNITYFMINKRDSEND